MMLKIGYDIIVHCTPPHNTLTIFVLTLKAMDDQGWSIYPSLFVTKHLTILTNYQQHVTNVTNKLYLKLSHVLKIQ